VEDACDLEKAVDDEVTQLRLMTLLAILDRELELESAGESERAFCKLFLNSRHNCERLIAGAAMMEATEGASLYVEAAESLSTSVSSRFTVIQRAQQTVRAYLMTKVSSDGHTSTSDGLFSSYLPEAETLIKELTALATETPFSSKTVAGSPQLLTYA
jgi:hypothetical protein